MRITYNLAATFSWKSNFPWTGVEHKEISLFHFSVCSFSLTAFPKKINTAQSRLQAQELRKAPKGAPFMPFSYASYGMILACTATDADVVLGFRKADLFLRLSLLSFSTFSSFFRCVCHRCAPLLRSLSS